MKKGVVLLSLMLFCISGFAIDLGASWVVTGEGKIECKKIGLGYNKARIMLENGQKMNFDYNNISSFSIDDRVFVKLRLYEDNMPVGKMAFMELIKQWNDLSLYKLACHDIGTADPKDVYYRYYIYKGMNHYLQLDDRTLTNTCKHFGIDKESL
jgi:hypothetical protein